MSRKYKYRNYGCDKGQWYISGQDTVNGGGGVLEWCIDAKDAEMTCAQMESTSEFKQLSVGEWKDSG